MIEPTHEQSPPSIAWSTVNIGEAVPGVLTPLGWTFWFEPEELGLLGAWRDLGVLAPREVRVAGTIEERLAAIFYGRAAGNVDRLRAMADRIPGTSGDALERQFLGAVRPGVVSHPTKRRYPLIAAKMPAVALRLPKRLARLRLNLDSWWRRSVNNPIHPDNASALISEAKRALAHVLRVHTQASVIAQAFYQQVAALAERGGRPGLEGSLVTGYGSVQGTSEMIDLWAVSRGSITLQDFVHAHGYHGPNEGDLSSHPWREDPAPLENLVETYKGMNEESSPQSLARRQSLSRVDAEQELLDGLPRRRRSSARFTLGLARRFIPLRESGKSTFLRTIDVARASARAAGAGFIEKRVLDDPDDVFFLTTAELARPLPADVKEVVAFRRARRDEYRGYRLPTSWTGMPTPTPIGEQPSSSGPIEGIGVSPGIVEGIARVVRDPAGAALEPGEILVCEITDPGWASLFLVASALVIDVGGPLSHGAIVARELGIPCVINTRDGTRRLHTGDRVHVDGSVGTVEILK